jgi:hypothetical protein
MPRHCLLLAQDLSRNARSSARRRARTTGQPRHRTVMTHTNWRHQSRRQAFCCQPQGAAVIDHCRSRCSTQDAATRTVVIGRSNRGRQRRSAASRTDHACDGRGLVAHQRHPDTETCQQGLQRQRISRDQRDPCVARAPSMSHFISVRHAKRSATRRREFDCYSTASPHSTMSRNGEYLQLVRKRQRVERCEPALPLDGSAYLLRLAGTFFPFLRALDNPIAIACLRLLTLPALPPRPLLAVPRL